MPYETDKSKIDDGQRNYAVYKDGEVNEATMFTPKSEVGHCASCGEAMPAYNKVITVTSGEAEYALMNGTWVYTKLNDEGDAAKQVFVDVKEEKNTSGQIVTSVNVVESAFEEGKGWNTTKYTIGTPVYSSKTGERTLKINDSYIVGEDGDDWTLTDRSGKNLLKESDDIIGTLKFVEGHNHQYKETPVGSPTEKAASIYADSYFEKMTFLGQYLMDDACHYVYCSGCGITNYPVAHLTSNYEAIDSTKLCTCGYTTNKDDESGNVYCSVSVYTGTIEYDQTDYYKALSEKKAVDNAVIEETSASDPDAATAPAKAAVENAMTVETTAGLTGSNSDKLLAVAAALESAINTADSDDAFKNAIEGAALSEAVEAYSEDNNREIEEAYDALVETQSSANTYLDDYSNDVDLAVDAMAKAIIAAAKELAEAAVAKAKADSVADIDEEAIDNFMILKGTVLNLEYSSCITNKGH